MPAERLRAFLGPLRVWGKGHGPAERDRGFHRAPLVGEVGTEKVSCRLAFDADENVAAEKEGQPEIIRARKGTAEVDESGKSRVVVEERQRISDAERKHPRRVI